MQNAQSEYFRSITPDFFCLLVDGLTIRQSVHVDKRKQCSTASYCTVNKFHFVGIQNVNARGLTLNLGKQTRKDTHSSLQLSR